MSEKPIVLVKSELRFKLSKPICRCLYKTLTWEIKDDKIYLECLNCQTKVRLTGAVFADVFYPKGEN